MKRVYVLPANESWIIDRFVDEWTDDNGDITVHDPAHADVIWLLADFCWEHLPMHLLRSRQVLTTVHHIVPEKFGARELEEFMRRDSVTTAYHVYNDRAHAQVSALTSKPIHVVRYWANQRLWRRTGTREGLRKKHGLPLDGYLVGSFQRDTEGHDLRSPKLEKGPDLLVDMLERLATRQPKLHVVLAGWRRHYVVRRLREARIPFTYVERPDQDAVNELYQTLDLYPVTARHEGGPQALIEAGLLGVPVVSRPVGIAEQLLPPTAIADLVDDAIPCVPNVDGWQLPHGYAPYRKLIEGLR